MLSACVGLVAGCLPAATLGSVPTVFVGWDVGLVFGVSCLLTFYVSFICACLSSFESLLSFTCSYLYSLGMSRLFVVVVDFCFGLC
jgi:hypothetical protein